MVETTLAIAGVATLLVSLVYAFVGGRFLRQQRGDASGLRALRFFALWWITTSLNQAMGAVLYIAFAFGQSDLTIHLTYVYLQRLLLAASLVGLMYYLLYLQTGRDHLIPLAVLYALYFASQMYALTARTPTHIESFGWRAEIEWRDAVSPLWQLWQLLIVIPPTIGALAMLRVYRRVEGPTRRFRIAMIGIGFVVWWLVAIAAGQPQAFDVAWLQALNRAVGLAVAIGVLLAYEPMAWMRRRYRLEPFSSQGGG